MARSATAVAPTSSRLPPREELWLLAGAVLVGIVLRWSFLGRVAIEHYDEAVYASNLLFGEEGGFEFPGRQFHAPAFVPALIEWTTILWNLFGLPAVSWLPMVPGLVCGTALIPSAWWTCRRWFSPAAGIATAWLVAMSEFHAFYSRTALTDPIVVLWMLWAVHWAWIALEDGSIKSAALAGLFTALAWWTKYSGWLPIAIAVSGGTCDVWLTPHKDRNWSRFFRVTAVMTGVAFVLWSPVLWDCQVVGGYAAVAANHRGYLQGWGAWWGNFLRQNANTHWYSGVLTLSSWGIAAYAADLVMIHGSASRHTTIGWIGVAVIAFETMLNILGYPFAAELICGVCVVGLALRAWFQARIPRGEQRAGCLIAAWFAGLLLTTPLYQPYPRLDVPLWLAGVLGVGWWLHRCVETYGSVHPLYASRRKLPWWIAPIPVAIVWMSAWLLGSHPAWEPRQSTRDASRTLAAELKDPARTVIYVYADPACFYELSKAGVAALPRGDLRIEKSPAAAETLLALGSYVDRLPDFPALWATEERRYEPLSDIPVEPSSLVLLDNDSPTDLFRTPSLRKRVWRIYRVR